MFLGDHGRNHADQEDRDLRKLLELRQAAVRAERSEADAIAALHAGARRSAGRPQWMEKRHVPGAATAAPCARSAAFPTSGAERAVSISANTAAVISHALDTPTQRRGGTNSGWGNIWGDKVSTSSTMSHLAEDSSHGGAASSSLHCERARTSGAASGLTTAVSSPSASAPVGSWSQQRVPRVPIKPPDAPRSQPLAPHRRDPGRAAAAPVLDVGGPPAASSSSRAHCPPRARGAEHAACAELEALRQVSLAEDEDLMQQLNSRASPRGHGTASTRVARSAPAVPKPSEVPPSLRAWRRHRHLEEVVPGAGQEEAKKQAARMKNSLGELKEEIQKLQDLMEEDALELVENVRTIRAEVQLARSRRRGDATPATTAGPSGLPSPGSSAAPSAVATPRGSRPLGLNPGLSEIKDAMLRAAELPRPSPSPHTDRNATASGASRRVAMRPLPVSFLGAFRGTAVAGSGAVSDLNSVLVGVPAVGPWLAELVGGVSGLSLGSICRAGAASLHSRDGRRIWPRVELCVEGRQAADVVRSAATAICWDAVKGLSVYGASDSTIGELLQLMPSNLSALSIRCTNRGSASAVETRNCYGDFMGIGSFGFRAVLGCVSMLPGNELRELDLVWNHLDDGAMAALRSSWPQGLKSLRLSWNEIGPDGATDLAAALAKPESAALTELDLRSSPLSDRGAVTICEAVAERHGLLSLGLGETSMTDEGASAALPLLQLHPSLSSLDIGENVLTDKACSAAADLLAAAPRLKKVILRGFLFEPTRITDSGGRALATGIARRAARGLPALDVDLDYQQVACGTAQDLARCCGAWSRLSLLNTDVSTMGAMAIANAFRQRPELARATRLNVAQCRVNTGAVELLRSAKFMRLDSHGQRQHKQGHA